MYKKYYEEYIVNRNSVFCVKRRLDPDKTWKLGKTSRHDIHE